MSRTLPTIVHQILAATVATFLIYEVASSTLARRAELHGDPETALNLRSQGASAATASAMRSFRAGDSKRAEVLSVRALSTSPLNQEALMTLALARARNGNVRSANNLFSLAASGGWRLAPVQLWMIETALAHGNSEAAVLRIDGLLRQEVLDEQLIPLLRRLAADRNGRRTLAGRLSENPPWRRPLLSTLAGLTPDLYGAHEGLLLELKAAGSPATSSEISTYLSDLLSKGQAERAMLFWRKISGRIGDRPLIEDPQVKIVADGADEPNPFSWSTTQTAGLSVAAAPHSGNSGALLAFADAGTAKALEQTLVLAPGHYRLGFRWKSPQRDGTSLRWTLACNTGPEIVPDARANLGLSPDQKFTITDFTVPLDHCAAQQLALFIDASHADSAAVELIGITLTRHS